MQHSIFEPLYSLQAHCNIMEECQAPKPSSLSQASLMPAPSLFSISPSSFHAINRENSPSSFDQDISCSLHAHIITPSSSKKARSEQDFTSDLSHLELPLSHPTLSATTPPPCSINANSTHSKLSFSHSFTSRCDDRKCDDGSVASKLLSSMTKSISSPSLHLIRSCKEAARETSYQKTLKLKQMKLQHCAEALGMESSDNSSFLYDSQCIHQEKIDMIGNPSSCPPSFTLPSSHQESSLKSVKSAPNLRSAPSLMTNHSRYTRSTSFPPPLSHTLPTSSSYDSLCLSLRVCRENGRFILKETMVPSKHYFHANRGNGRLTLHVFTREEEEEHFACQDDHQEFSYQESQREDMLAEEEEDILQCVVSLFEETLDGGLDNKEEDSTNTTQSLNEEVCGKKIVVMDSSKEINIAGSHLNMSLQRLNCLALHNKKKDSEDDDKRNVISNVITLSLQSSSHPKVTLHKAQVLSFPHLSRYPLISGTMKQSALIHSAERNQGLLPRNHDIKFPQSNENFIWESNVLMPRACTRSSPRKQRKGGIGSSGGGGGGGGGSGVTLPAFAMEEMRAKSLMKAVSDQLATSLILDTSYARGNWCLEGKKKPAAVSAVESGESGTIIGGYARESAIKDGDEGAIISEGAKFGYNTNEEEKANKTSEGGMKELNIISSPLNLDLHFPSSSTNLQSEEWLHTLHCKELFDRHQLGQCFMKIHCIPTRS